MDDIWLGDLARAFAALSPRDEEDRRAIAAVLGLCPPATLEQGETSSLDTTANSAVKPAPPTVPPPSQDPVWVTTPDKPGASGRSSLTDLPLLTPVGVESPPAISWQVHTLPRPDPRRPHAALPHEPLLAPRSSHAIMHLMLAQETADGPVDTAAVVASLARRHPLRAMPRKRQRTLRFGAQLLVDRSFGMQPFARDQTDAIGQVRALLGPERTDVQYFIGSPLRGMLAGPARRHTPYRLPATGTQVLLLSDLGVIDHGFGPRALPSEWARFLAMLHRQGFDPVALVPYPQHRLPRSLTTLLRPVTWDRSATVGRVRARLR